MKSKWLIAVPILLLILALCVLIVLAGVFAFNRFNFSSIPGLGANFRAEETVTESFAVTSPAVLDIENSFGWIHINTGDVDEITMEARKIVYSFSKADAEAELQNLEIITNLADNKLTIDVPMDDLPSRAGFVKRLEVEFTITVPAETSVIVNSDFGEVSVAGTTGSADITTGFGGIEVQNLTGSLTISNQNGSTTLSGIRAGADKIQVISSFGEINVNGAEAGSIYLKSNNGGISLEDGYTSGAITLDSGFGDVRYSVGRAETVSINSDNGEVMLKDVTVNAEVTATSNFGDVTVFDVSAKRYTIQSQNGELILDGAAGAIKAKSGFGSITLHRAQDVTLDLRSDNGSIKFDGSLGSGPHVVSSNFGSIEMILPANSNLNIDMDTDFGDIDTDFEILTSGKQSEKEITGKIGSGGDLLEVHTNNGSISLFQSK